MRSLKLMILVALVLMVAAVPVFAQGAAAGAGGDLRFLGAAIGMGIASGLCGIGQGRAAASAAEAVARNPGARAGVQTLLVLGLAFIESLAIFTLLIIFVKY